MSADLGLVAHAADRDALEAAAHRVGDRPPQRGLADAGRPDEAEDRRARVRLEPAHGEELEDAVLDRLDVVVVAVEHLAAVLEVEVVLGRPRPGQVGEPLEIGADHAVLGGLRRQPLEALQLALRLLPGVLRQLGGLEALAQLGRLGLDLVDLAELLLDRLELLAQEVLALPAIHLRLDLRLDPRADLDQLLLARQDLREPPQAPRHVALLEQPLLLLGRDPQRPGDDVRELGGVVDVRDRHLQLGGQVGDLLDDAREGRLHVAVERLELGGGDDDVGRLGDARDQIGLGGHEVAELDALGAVHEDAQRPVRHLHHARHDTGHADAVEVVGPGLLAGAVARRDHHQHAAAGEHVVDEPHRALLADRQRNQGLREGNALAQRQHRQRLGQDRAHRRLGGLSPGRGDVDRHEAGSSMRTRRTVWSGCASGISTSSMPSS